MNVYKIYENYNVNTHQHFIKYIASNFGIHDLEIDVLSYLYANGETNQVQLGNALGQNKTNISRLIDKLEAKNLVERKQNVNNRREKIIVFAPRTYQIIVSYMEVLNELNQKVLAELKEEEIIIFQKILDIMHNHVEELIKENK